MPRARFQNQDEWQTALASENGSGCLSFYMLPPIAALVIVGFVVFVALWSPLTPEALPVAAHNSTMLLQTSAPPVSSLLSANPTPIWSFGSSNTTSSSGISPVFTKEVQHWGNDIMHWANAAG